MKPLNLILVAVVGVLFLIALLVAIIIASFIEPIDYPGDLAHAQFAIPWLATVLGTFLVAASALGLLVLALLGAPLERLAAFVISLLGGVLLIQLHWAPAAALGAFGVAIVVKQIFANRGI